MKGSELKKKYLEFFKSKGHVIIGSAPLVPEHDPSVLFTTAGMHPLVPYLMGQPHPGGKRLTNFQKCIRTQDIDEVGDNTHTTFFEMLGNWSLGDYFKKEAITWSHEFLTSKDWLNLDIKRLAVTCFEGDNNAPRDEEAASIWKGLGMPESRIVFLSKKDNWWGPPGEIGPCGPDTEMFYWTPNDKSAPEVFDSTDKRWVEIWNNVFMEYNKTIDGTFETLAQKNVDTGLGVERVTMVLQGKQNIFDTELFQPIIKKIKEIAPHSVNNQKYTRIITDHMRAAVFILGDKRDIVPGKIDQGYVLRRYIRRVLRYLRLLDVNLFEIDATVEIAKIIIETYKIDYPELEEKKEFIFRELKKEEDKFQSALDNGLKEFEKMVKKDKKISGEEAFLLFQSYGFPIEMIKELTDEAKVLLDSVGFMKEYNKHKELSRIGGEQKFKGGMSESSEKTKKFHTATHLLNEALRQVLKDSNIKQKGSNITVERLRFDFNFHRKLTKEELNKIEDLVNLKINEAIPVERYDMTFEESKKLGAQAEFKTKYNEKVSVYKIGFFSVEVCGGPHVSNTSELGYFKIQKEESSAAGVRRIKAVLE
ncbi:alanine--tRNA ligase [Candidatus Woesearchaeota archaeon]|nr:alanine--tRNA ligase [Candidatus Woesearchaeota archaeon]